MRISFNPDGARIRVLRIQRGWTQEQLAEIAGISARTVQRAESANRASFETVKAIAGAFETDFGKLINLGAQSASDPEPKITDPADVPGPAPEIELILNDPKTPALPVWALPLLSTSTLILALVIGVFLRPHFNVDEKSRSSRSPEISEINQQIEMYKAPVPHELTSTQKQEPIRKAPDTLLMQAAVSNHKLDIAESASNLSPAEQQAESTVKAEPGLRDTIPRSQESGSLELSLPPQNRLSELVIPDVPPVTNGSPVLLDGSTPDQPDLGAVRQAMDLAAKKTGTVVSKVSASVKRIF